MVRHVIRFGLLPGNITVLRKATVPREFLGARSGQGEGNASIVRGGDVQYHFFSMGTYDSIHPSSSTVLTPVASRLSAKCVL